MGHGRRHIYGLSSPLIRSLIGSIRRECVDHIVVLGEGRLRHVLKCYMSYYNEVCMHLFLHKNAPASRSIQTAWDIFCRPILGGLHH
jgi:hypothetical protein